MIAPFTGGGASDPEIATKKATGFRLQNHKVVIAFPGGRFLKSILGGGQIVR
jgi:hypothetical protein